MQVSEYSMNNSEWKTLRLMLFFSLYIVLLTPEMASSDISTEKTKTSPSADPDTLVQRDFGDLVFGT